MLSIVEFIYYFTLRLFCIERQRRNAVRDSGLTWTECIELSKFNDEIESECGKELKKRRLTL